MQVRKTQVHVCSGRKRKYENGLSDVDMAGKTLSSRELLAGEDATHNNAYNSIVLTVLVFIVRFYSK